MVSPWFDSRGGAKHTEMKNLIKGPRNAPSKNDQKALIKKLYKSGLFHTFKMGKNYISWIDSGGRIFSWQSGLFRSGFVFKYDELAPTYESEYNDLGLVERVCFVPDIEVRTDSVRYVHINAVNITLPNTL